MRNLYQAGFANQPISENRDDGLCLHGCYLTAAVKCVPPANKPSRQEFLNCSQYYHRELVLLPKLKAILALGRLAFNAFLCYAKKQRHSVSNIMFMHGGVYHFEGLPLLYNSYHPSPQNTNTGILTAAMFLHVLTKIRAKHG